MENREPPLVIPSSMRFYTPLLPVLIEKNPGLARDAIRAINLVDRSRNILFREVLGDKVAYV